MTRTQEQVLAGLQAAQDSARRQAEIAAQLNAIAEDLEGLCAAMKTQPSRAARMLYGDALLEQLQRNRVDRARSRSS